ncbi:hypothetical protein DFQ28_009496 [Apophysomyces sp. BC1034]|nr:hypothetical protein DFQ30_008911 [Apophysomyces sp. BC1015]KAG0172894.1 hypothetical protein DFQ29_008193 [Apophysomyces sp. BC1021]KAG0185348.1 hypothetical protein DFQ28_009496 [Apophysomyces sp. BC1034]
MMNNQQSSGESKVPGNTTNTVPQSSVVDDFLSALFSNNPPAGPTSVQNVPRVQERPAINDTQATVVKSSSVKRDRAPDEFEEYSMLSKRQNASGLQTHQGASQKNGFQSRGNGSGASFRRGPQGKPHSYHTQARRTAAMETPQILSRREINWDNLAPESRMLVRRLPSSAEKRQIMDYFSNYGEVLEVVLKNNYGFVQFSDSRACAAAVQQENGRHYKGVVLDLEVCRQKPCFARDSDDERHTDQRPNHQITRMGQNEYRGNHVQGRYGDRGMRGRNTRNGNYGRGGAMVKARPNQNYGYEDYTMSGNYNLNKQLHLESDRYSEGYGSEDNDTYNNGGNWHNDNHGYDDRYDPTFTNDSYDHEIEIRRQPNRAVDEFGRSNGYRQKGYDQPNRKDDRLGSRHGGRGAHVRQRGRGGFQNIRDKHPKDREDFSTYGRSPMSENPKSYSNKGVLSPAVRKTTMPGQYQPITSGEEFSFPRRYGKDVPIVQVITRSDVNRSFVEYIENVFKSRSIHIQSLSLPYGRPSRDVVVKEMILEGVKAIVIVEREHEAQSKVYLQVFAPNDEAGNVRFDEYANISVEDAVTIVQRMQQIRQTTTFSQSSSVAVPPVQATPAYRYSAAMTAASGTVPTSAPVQTALRATSQPTVPIVPTSAPNIDVSALATLLNLVQNATNQQQSHIMPAAIPQQLSQLSQLPQPQQSQQPQQQQVFQPLNMPTTASTADTAATVQQLLASLVGGQVSAAPNPL